MKIKFNPDLDLDFQASTLADVILVVNADAEIDPDGRGTDPKLREEGGEGGSQAEGWRLSSLDLP